MYLSKKILLAKKIKVRKKILIFYRVLLKKIKNKNVKCDKVTKYLTMVKT